MKFLKPLDPHVEADLPERKKTFFKLAGPGAILVGLSIGAGEMVVWPRIVSEYGSGMIWAAGVGVFLQMWINFEVGRWTVATGETVYTGLCRVWKGCAVLFILFNVLGWLAPGWGRASGLALKALLFGPDHPSSDTFWTVVTFAGVAFLLFGPKFVYQSVERTVELLVAVITFHTIIPAFLTRGGQPVGPFGVMGGHMQPQGHTQVVVGTVDYGLNPQAALDAPRWRWASGLEVGFELDTPEHVLQALAARGHRVQIGLDRADFGRGQIIWRLDEGVYVAGSDKRSDGAAVGW